MGAESKIQAAAGPAVYAAISAVMEHMAKEGIGKDRKNTQQGYKFRGIDDVYNTLCGVLAANKLMMLPFVVDMKREDRQTKNGGALNYTILTVDFKLVCAVDGSSDTVRMIGEAMDSADKSSNKAQSAALKYAALQVFMIPTEADNDADATTHDVEPRNQRQQDDDAGGMPDAEFAKLNQLVEATKSNTNEMCKFFKVKSLRHLDQNQYGAAIARLNEKLAAMAKEETNAKAGAGFGEILDDEIPY